MFDGGNYRLTYNYEENTKNRGEWSPRPRWIGPGTAAKWEIIYIGPVDLLIRFFVFTSLYFSY